jgi:hypothetical protein
VDAFAGEDLNVSLYTNNYTPVDGSVTANFTEATFAGYVPRVLSNGSMDNSTIVADVAVGHFGSAPTYTCTGGSPQTVYGWFLTGDSSGLTYLAQKFDTPRVMNTGAVEALDPFNVKLKTFA